MDEVGGAAVTEPLPCGIWCYLQVGRVKIQSNSQTLCLCPWIACWYGERLGLPWWFSGKESACKMHEMQLQSLDREDPLEEDMATHSSILAWEISWTERRGGLQSMGSCLQFGWKESDPCKIRIMRGWKNTIQFVGSQVPWYVSDTWTFFHLHWWCYFHLKCFSFTIFSMFKFFFSILNILDSFYLYNKI